jgi:hypothetical protein
VQGNLGRLRTWNGNHVVSAVSESMPQLFRLVQAHALGKGIGRLSPSWRSGSEFREG